MTNRLHIALLVLSACAGCDHEEEVEVPFNAGKGLSPPVFEVVPPEPEAPSDPVVVRVGEAEIRESAVAEELERIRLHHDRQRKPFGPEVEAAKREQVTEELIDRALLAGELARAQIDVGPTVIDAALAARAQNVFGTPEAMERHLVERGWTLDVYRRHLAMELGTRKLLEDECEPKPQDLEVLYREVANRPAAAHRARVASVLFPREVPPADVASFAGATKSAEQFRALTAKGAQNINDLGWVDRTNMDPRLAANLFTVEAPGVSAPIATPAGLQIYWVHELSVEPTEHFRELEPVLRTRAQSICFAEARRELLRELRAKAKIARVASTPEKR